MKTATCRLRGVSPMSQSRIHDAPMLEKETWDDYERRTWRNKMHVSAAGSVFIPPMALKMAIVDACQRRGEKVPGRGKTTYKKFFDAGVLCVEPIDLGIAADTIEGEWINANSDGVRGSGKRVKRCFPRIPEGWRGTASLLVLDNTVTKDVFERCLREAGSFVGLGRFRPINGGYYGRFVVEGLSWAPE